MTEEEALHVRFCELAEQCYTRGHYTYSDFLGLAEGDALYRAARTFPHVPYTLFGGTEGCERVMARFGDEVMLGYAPGAFPIACLRIRPVAPRFAEALSHRDYLGAVLHLGVRRTCVGDIVQDGQNAYLFCTEPMAPFLSEQLTRVRHTDVTVAPATPPPHAAVRRETETVQIASPRLDALLARVFSLSRAEAGELVGGRAAFINGRMCEDGSHLCRVGDIISLRGYGRFSIAEEQGLSRKGKLCWQIERYL